MALTEKDVRAFIQDRNAADNSGLDLAFSPEDVKDAMRRAAREYNSVPPLFIGVGNGDCLPDDTNIFLDATAEQLYLSELARLARSDIDYSAGGVVTPIERQLIAGPACFGCPGRALLFLFGSLFPAESEKVLRFDRLRRLRWFR